MNFRIRKKHGEVSLRFLFCGVPAIAKFMLIRIAEIKKNRNYPKSFDSYKKFLFEINKLEKGFKDLIIIEKYNSFDDNMLSVINSMGIKSTCEDMQGYNLLALNEKHELDLISRERYNMLENRACEALKLFLSMYKDLIEVDESINSFIVSFFEGQIKFNWATPVKYTCFFSDKNKYDYSQYLDVMKLDEDERWNSILTSILRAFKLSNDSLYRKLSKEEEEDIKKGFYYFLDNKNSLYI
ncbi:hypothetical protein [Clostridium perfringens]|nr:hypothetical protein [Clostridium perfringens]